MNKRDLAQKGDILFYTVAGSTSFFDKTVGFLERLICEPGIYCHVSLLDSTLDNQYEAVIPRLKNSPVNWSDPTLQLWRIRNASEVQRLRMLDSAKFRIGEWYGIGKSIASLLRRKQLEVCTDYVMDSALTAGIRLENEKTLVTTPDDLSKSTQIYRVF